jgi:hypothetical protein
MRNSQILQDSICHSKKCLKRKGKFIKPTVMDYSKISKLRRGDPSYAPFIDQERAYNDGSSLLNTRFLDLTALFS